MPCLRRFAPFLALLTAVACAGSDPIAPPPLVPASLEVIAGADQRGNALEQLPQDIGIRVLDDDGHAMPGVKMTLAVVDGEGIASAPEVTSDALGAVIVRWTLGPRTGAQHLRASIAGTPSLEATITATARPQLLASLQAAALVLLNEETGTMRQLFTQWVAMNPSWSPEGRRIAFIGRPDNSSGNRVYVTNADGSGAKPITTVTDLMTDEDVDWSPDGKHLLFTRIASTGARIYVVDPDGGNLAQLSTFESRMPHWSPDGKQIAFSMRDTSDSFWEIAVMNADGSNVRTLTNTQSDNDNPDWAPDGTRLVYAGWREGRPRLFVINADGTGDRLLTTDVPPNHLGDAYPAWSRDGNVIAFTRDFDTPDHTSYTSALYTIRPDGTGLTVVQTGTTAYVFGARWRP